MMLDLNDNSLLYRHIQVEHYLPPRRLFTIGVFIFVSHKLCFQTIQSYRKRLNLVDICMITSAGQKTYHTISGKRGM